MISWYSKTCACSVCLSILTVCPLSSTDSHSTIYTHTLIYKALGPRPVYLTSSSRMLWALGQCVWLHFPACFGPWPSVSAEAQCFQMVSLPGGTDGASGKHGSTLASRGLSLTADYRPGSDRWLPLGLGYRYREMLGSERAVRAPCVQDVSHNTMQQQSTLWFIAETMELHKHTCFYLFYWTFI